MRKILLSMEAQENYEVTKRLAEGHISKQTAAVKIGSTKRHIYRLLNKYQLGRKSAFLHANKGRKPFHAFSDQEKADIVAIYNNKYWDANFTHCCELLESQDPIKFSCSICLFTES